MIQKNITHFKYLSLLSMLYTTVLSTAVLLDYKFIKLGHMLASAATFVISLTFFLSDVITEVYGYQRARQVIWSSLACLLFFTTVCFLLNKLETPSEYVKFGQAYNVILNSLFRASLANAFAIVLGAFINIYVISKWKILIKGKYFWLRSLGSSAFGEIIYTIFVVALVNIGLVPFGQLIQILTISYLFKLLFDIFAVIPVSLLAAFLKKSEGIDSYDYNINFNPLKFEVVQNNV